MAESLEKRLVWKRRLDVTGKPDISVAVDGRNNVRVKVHGGANKTVLWTGSELDALIEALQAARKIATEKERRNA